MLGFANNWRTQPAHLMLGFANNWRTQPAHDHPGHALVALSKCHLQEL